MPPDDPSLERLRHALHALAEPHRFRLVRRLSQGPCSVTELVGETGWPQPLVSHHLKILCEAGLASAIRTGRCRHYSLQNPAEPALRDILALLRGRPVPAPARSIPDPVVRQEMEDFLL